MSRFAEYIRPYVRIEFAAAADCAERKDFAASFRHLERAHVLGQRSTYFHVLAHWRMLLWAVQRRDAREAAGQILRIIGAATVTAAGLVPTGNTGGANVSPLRPMPIAEDLAALLADAPKNSTLRFTNLWAFALLALAVASFAFADAPENYRTANLDDHRVAFRVIGSGRPAIVLIAGLGDGMAMFENVARDLAKTNTVIVYDRAGYGGNTPGSGPRDAAAAERELSGLLAQSGVDGPVVLSGHSLGGLFAEYFAAKNPDRVMGLVLEESRPAEFSARCAAALGPAGCRPPAWAIWLMPKGARDEFAALGQTVTQVEGATPLEAKPVLLLSRPVGDAENGSFEALWADGQVNLALRYPGSRHLFAESGGHYIHRDQSDWFVESVRSFAANLH